MKYLFIYFSIFTLNCAISQITDSTCIYERWIALKPTEPNSKLFFIDTLSNEEYDLIHIIKELVETNKMDLHSQHNGFTNNKEWYKLDYLNESINKTLGSKYNPLFQIAVPSDTPYIDLYGEDSISLNPDGSFYYVYPPPTIYNYSTASASEIRIKERRVFDESSQTYKFEPIGLSFYFINPHNSYGKELFWIDLRQLFRVIENSSQYPWYSILKEKKYRGFQYMQSSCYDNEIR